MKPNFENLLIKLKGSPVLCGRCYEYVDEVFPAKCNEKPEDLIREAIGMYHCPECGTMVLAGVPHPDICADCLNGKKKGIDY